MIVAMRRRDDIRIYDTETSPTLESAMGGGGGNIPMIVSAYGIVSKGNGDCFLADERHTSLSVGGGQAGQGYPCVLVIEEDGAENSNGKTIL